jgi:hypothetical protein
MGAFSGSPIVSPLQSLSSQGMVRLNGTRMSTTDVASQVVSWTDNYEQLVLWVAVPFYAGADAVSLRFGNAIGSVDSGTNYWSRWVTQDAGNVSNISQTLFQLGIATANGRSAWIHMLNFKDRRKVGAARVAIGSASAAAVPDVHLVVDGMWDNTTDFIHSVQLVLPGAGKLGAGSQVVVFGMNAG